MTPNLDCDVHSGVPALHQCFVCGKPVCDDCAVTHRGVVLCNDSDHATVYDTYHCAFETATVFEMDLIVRNLREQGLEGRWFDPHWFGNAEPCRLFLQPTDITNARSIIEELDLHDFILPDDHGK